MTDENKRTFLSPHATKLNPKTGMQEVDLPNSEEFIRLEAYGAPPVHYATKQNRYYRDPECTKAFRDEELQQLGLPLPIEIESARRKLIKQANDNGQLADMDAIRRATSPQKIEHPQRIRERLVTRTSEDKMIERINRSELAR